MPQQVPRRVFVSFDSLGQPKLGEVYLLPEDVDHHLRDVLRLSEGSLIQILNALGGEVAFEASLLSHRSAVRITRALPLEDRICPVHTLVFALSKGEKNDFVCEKATELGVSNIVFWQAERSIVRLRSDEDREKKLKRWKSIARSASEQCRRATVPSVKIAETVSEVAANFHGTPLVCSLSEDAISLSKALHRGTHVTMLIGPEGDISPAEDRALRESNCIPVTLGPYILRAETAAVVAIAQVLALWEIV